MKSAGIQEIKSALKDVTPSRLKELCLLLAKHKTENKELLSYLLFDAENPETYIHKVKEQMDVLFQGVNTSNQYYAKKGFRKVLRFVNKQIRFTRDKKTEAELLIHYCLMIRRSGVEIKPGSVLENLYLRQHEKIKSAIDNLHEDIRFDFQPSLEALVK